MSDPARHGKGNNWDLRIDVDAVVKQLSALPDKLQRKALREALRKAVTFQQRLLKHATPVKLGALRQSWKVRQVRYRALKHTIGFKVRPDSQFRRVRLRTAKGRMRLATRKRTELEIAKATARGEKLPTVRPSKYAHLVEFGHQVRRNKGGRVLGRVTPDPFAARVLADSETSVRGIFGKIVERFLRAEQGK